MTEMQTLFRVRVPLAKRALFAGVRLAVVSTIGIGTIAGRGNSGLTWERRLAAAARLETTSFFVLWHENMLILTCEAYYNGPYGYLIWGK